MPMTDSQRIAKLKRDAAKLIARRRMEHAAKSGVPSDRKPCARCESRDFPTVKLNDEWLCRDCRDWLAKLSPDAKAADAMPRMQR
jgi:hypothetical protein